jgi:hypothetical protein
MIDRDPSREAFEKWARSLSDKPNLTREGAGYRYVYAECYWKAWQAAMAHKSAPETQEEHALPSAIKVAPSESKGAIASVDAHKNPASSVAGCCPWQSIATAPKDDTWLMLWRTPEPFGSVMQSDPFIIARWSEEYEEFVWPDSPFDPFTPHGRAIANAIVDEGRRIFETDDFTHWMPLPAAPLQQGE